jgi:hypothetical protein
LRSQFATLRTGRGQHRKFLPYAFTEQGVAMLSSVVNILAPKQQPFDGAAIRKPEHPSELWEQGASSV